MELSQHLLELRSFALADRVAQPRIRVRIAVVTGGEVNRSSLGFPDCTAAFGRASAAARRQGSCPRGHHVHNQADLERNEILDRGVEEAALLSAVLLGECDSESLTRGAPLLLLGSGSATA